jgi:hypothetical protein
MLHSNNRVIVYRKDTQYNYGNRLTTILHVLYIELLVNRHNIIRKNEIIIDHTYRNYYRSILFIFNKKNE